MANSNPSERKDNTNNEKEVLGYLPDERPPFLELIFFALQQIVVMFPATVLVALITGFHVSTTIFASGLATLVFILVTGKKIPLYYGSSFSYIAAIASIMGAEQFAGLTLNERISIAQFGIVLSGLVSIVAGLVINKVGQKAIDKVLPPTVTGSIAMVIGLSLAANALSNASSVPAGLSEGQIPFATDMAMIIAIITLISTILYSVYLKGTLSQFPILFGLFTGYAVALIIGGITGIGFVNFNTIETSSILTLPIFTFPKANLAAIAAIMPIAIATIPESTAHIYQLDIYVNDLAGKKATKKRYDLAGKLGLNLIGDGIGDIVSGFIGGPAGTNYGENISCMAISKNFSVPVLITAAIITMIISCFTPLINIIYSIPTSVIGGLSIYLFGIIAAQGITIMMDKKVDMFSSRNLAIIAVIMIIGLGGTYNYSNGMIPLFGQEFPAIATAAISGIVLNLLLSIRSEE
ncbi:MAG: solute carrier family 23 protein [Tissierellia bacterium]|nr:solute carrier family 23 protein [Tissierellia bacterium]MDD4725720.1 solute carrier family 23 protein [Tissierellia bacterium]